MRHRVLRAPILLGLTALTDWPGARARLRRDHHTVLDAVRQRRGADAADLVAEHIRTAYQGCRRCITGERRSRPGQ